MTIVAEWTLVALVGAVIGWVVVQGRYAPGHEEAAERSEP